MFYPNSEAGRQPWPCMEATEGPLPEARRPQTLRLGSLGAQAGPVLSLSLSTGIRVTEVQDGTQKTLAPKVKETP